MPVLRVFFRTVQRCHARSWMVTAQLQWTRAVGMHGCPHPMVAWAITMPLCCPCMDCACAALRLGAAELPWTQPGNPSYQLPVLAVQKGAPLFPLVRIYSFIIRTCLLWCCKLWLHVVITKKFKMQWNKWPQKIFDLLNLPLKGCKKILKNLTLAACPKYQQPTLDFVEF